MRIWLDDERDPQNSTVQEKFGAFGNEVWVKTAEEAIDLIESGRVVFISFDHDLGQGLTGHDVAKKIEELAHFGKVGRIEYRVHSANPPGRDNILRTMESAEKEWNKRND